LFCFLFHCLHCSLMFSKLPLFYPLFNPCFGNYTHTPFIFLLSLLCYMLCIPIVLPFSGSLLWCIHTFTVFYGSITADKAVTRRVAPVV
jgi:hypothetical protein